MSGPRAGNMLTPWPFGVAQAPAHSALSGGMSIAPRPFQHFVSPLPSLVHCERANGGWLQRTRGDASARTWGFVDRGKGDHINVKMPNGQIVTFSGKREPIKIGLLKAMLRKAGPSEAEFLRLIEGEC